MAETIGGLVDRGAISQKLRTADGNQDRCHEVLRYEAGIVAEPVADGDVDSMAPQVDQLRACLDPYLDVGVLSREAAKPRYEPRCREGWHRADCERASGIGRHHRFEAALDLIESAQQGWMDLGAGIRQLDAVAGPHDQRQPDSLLELLDLLADSARGDAHRPGSALDAAVASGLHKSAQGKEWQD